MNFEFNYILSYSMIAITVVYLAAFWGSALIKGCYIYLNDGDKRIKDLCEVIKNKGGDPFNSVGYNILGIMMPLLTLALAALVGIIENMAGHIPVIIVSICLIAWIALYIMRSVIRLNKKLDKHASDKEAHK